MSHVRKLILTGEICGRDSELRNRDRDGDASPSRVQSYYSWPRGERQSVVEDIIKGFRKAFCNVTVVIEHNHLD